MKKKRLTLYYTSILSIIAVIISIIVLSIGVFMWIKISKQNSLPFANQHILDTSVKTTENTREEVSMTDNSKIWLNFGTTVRYASDYRDNRTVRLTGHGYFKIKEQERSFTVLSDGITLALLGGSFEFENYPDKEYAHLTLYTGEVKIINDKHPDGILTNPGIKLLLNKKTGEIELDRIKQDAKGPGWIVHKFEHMTFNNILYQLSQYYDIFVTNKRPDLNNDSFSLTAEGDMPLKEVMDIMQTISNKFMYQITGDELIIF